MCCIYTTKVKVHGVVLHRVEGGGGGGEGLEVEGTDRRVQTPSMNVCSNQTFVVASIYLLSYGSSECEYLCL